VVRKVFDLKDLLTENGKLPGLDPGFLCSYIQYSEKRVIIRRLDLIDFILDRGVFGLTVFGVCQELQQQIPTG
jgi:hypothetical protein